MELIDRAAWFPAVKSFETFDFTAIPSLNKVLVLELARSESILQRENIIALGNSDTVNTPVALSLGLAACQKGFTVAFKTAAALVSQLRRPEVAADVGVKVVVIRQRASRWLIRRSH